MHTLSNRKARTSGKAPISERRPRCQRENLERKLFSRIAEQTSQGNIKPMRKLDLGKVYQKLEPGPVVLLTTAENGRANVMTMSWHMMVEYGFIG